MDRSQALLAPIQIHSQQLLEKAKDAAATLDVLTVKDTAEALEVLARQRRMGLEAKATELALVKTVEKLELMEKGDGNLDTLVRVATALSPERLNAVKGGTTVAVQVVFRKEYTEG